MKRLKWLKLAGALLVLAVGIGVGVNIAIGIKKAGVVKPLAQFPTISSRLSQLDPAEWKEVTARLEANAGLPLGEALLLIREQATVRSVKRFAIWALGEMGYLPALTALQRDEDTSYDPDSWEAIDSLLRQSPPEKGDRGVRVRPATGETPVDLVGLYDVAAIAGTWYMDSDGPSEYGNSTFAAAGADSVFLVVRTRMPGLEPFDVSGTQLIGGSADAHKAIAYRVGRKGAIMFSNDPFYSAREQWYSARQWPKIQCQAPSSGGHPYEWPCTLHQATSPDKPAYETAWAGRGGPISIDLIFEVPAAIKEWTLVLRGQ